MKDVSGQGRTVLFVSHNMDAINTLCSRVIVLNKGIVDFDGLTSNGVNRYLANNQTSTDLADYRLKDMGKMATIVKVESLSENAFFVYGQPLKYRVTVQSDDSYENLRLVFGVFNTRESAIAISFPDEFFSISKGETRTLEISVKSNDVLTPDTYLASFSLIKGSMLDGYESLDIILGYPSFEVYPPSTGALNKNMMNWKKGWGNILLEGLLTKID